MANNWVKNLQRFVREGVETKLARVNTCLPARIISYDPATQKASIAVSGKKLLIDNQVKSYPTIQNVPVQFPSTQRSMITMELAPNDEGMIIFSQRSLDLWKGLADAVYDVVTQDRRKHDYSDAIFIPGVTPFARAINDNAKHTTSHSYDELVIAHNIGTKQESKIRLHKNGDLSSRTAGGSQMITKEGAHKGTTKQTWSMTNDTGELIDLLTQALTTIKDTTVNTIYGASPLNNKLAIEAILAQLETFKE